MVKTTKQMEKWIGSFGKDYTKRNVLAPDELDGLYKKTYDITRTALNEIFVGKLKRDIKILEVGSNTGDQLALLQKMGFKNLYAIELNNYAIELFKSRIKDITVIQASAFDIPFKDSYFDLVFTSGFLIHISPSDVKMAIKEIYRCAKEYIWGFEYYADEYTEVIYRGKKNLLWKTNFSELYIDLFDDLKLIKEKRLKYLNNENIDTMFLLKKVDKL